MIRLKKIFIFNFFGGIIILMLTNSLLISGGTLEVILFGYFAATLNIAVSIGEMIDEI